MNTNKLVLLFLFPAILFLQTCNKVEKEMLVKTGSVSNIKANSADVSGEILDMGEGASQHGHCYSKTPGALITDMKIEKGIPSETGLFTSSLPNLEAGTKYYVKAYMSRANEVVYGQEINFSTSAATLPVVSTSSIGSVTQVSASSGGNVTSEGGSPVTARGVCWNTTTGPTISNSTTSNGGGLGEFTSNLTALTQGTTYFLRAYATNSVGTAYGSEVMFSTLQLPALSTLAATLITNTSATLNATVNANNYSTIVTFEYGLTASYGLSVPAVQSPLTGATPEAVTAELTGLTPGATYHFRVKGVNLAGTVTGEDMIMVMLQLPSATISSANAITGVSATLNGIVNGNNLSTTVTFEYGNTTAYGAEITASQSPVSGNTNVNVSANITGLSSNTTYHYRIKAVNSSGTIYSGDMNFNTLQLPPVVTSIAASAITSSTATLNGNINANGLSTAVTFDYGTTTGYGNSVTASQSPVSGSTPTAVSATATVLTPNTIYHFRVQGVSTGGTTQGNDLSFTTQAAVTTSAISSITGTTATGGGSVAPDGGATISERGICLSTNSNPTTSDTKLPQGSGTGSFVRSITGLAQNTTYYVRAYGINAGGTSYGNQVSFTTLLLPAATTTTPSSVTTTTATLNGSVNANNSSTVVTFEYGISLSYGTEITAVQSPVTGAVTTSVSAGLTGLISGTTYNYRVKAVSVAGTSTGSNNQFTTLRPPAATTTAATLITNTTAQMNATVNAYNSSTVVTFEYGTSTSYGGSVLADQSPVTGSTVTIVSKGLTGLVVGTTYHFRVKAVSEGGTTYGNDISFLASYAIGQSFGGGNIFYVDGTGMHGLIAATVDQSINIGWEDYNYGVFNTGAIATAIGTGQANTTLIVNAQVQGTYAARLCQDLVLNGYSDWYLPSKDEMYQLWLNRAAVGTITSGDDYWTSTEYNGDYQQAWFQSFCCTSSVTGKYYKYANLSVRAIRSF